MGTLLVMVMRMVRVSRNCCENDTRLKNDARSQNDQDSEKEKSSSDNDGDTVVRRGCVIVMLEVMVVETVIGDARHVDDDGSE